MSDVVEDSPTGFVAFVARSLGAPQDGIRLMISLLLGMIFKKFLSFNSHALINDHTMCHFLGSKLTRDPRPYSLHIVMTYVSWTGMGPM